MPSRRDRHDVGAGKSHVAREEHRRETRGADRVAQESKRRRTDHVDGKARRRDGGADLDTGRGRREDRERRAIAH
jgi:hypothetical protein